MRIRPWIIWSLAVLLAVLAVGCGAKKEAATTATDSTAFATNPTEQGQGGITPQAQVPPPEPAAQPKTEPAPKATAAKPPAHKSNATPQTPAPAPSITVSATTPLKVALTTNLSSETAKVGDAWTGVVKENVLVGEKTAIPAGSIVRGTVSAVKPAAKGDRAMLDLAIGSLTVEGADYAAGATTEAIVAGSTRARNIGAVAGGAGAGALIGGAVGGKKGALIGGLLGAAGAGGAVASSKGYQVVLKEGVELVFSTSQPLSIKR